MTIAERGTLPGYTSAIDTDDFLNLQIGERALTVFEEADMLLLGWERDAICAMTPNELHAAADDASCVLLGS